MSAADHAAPAAVSADGEPPLVLDVAEDAHARVTVTGRAQGTASTQVGRGEPHPARTAALAPLGLEAASLVLARQIHGARVATVGRDDLGRGATRPDEAVPDADALVTTASDVAVGVLVADCVPVALVAPGRGVAVVHAGRGGIVAGVVGAAVAALAQEARCRPDALAAIIGPGIGGCCYEVPVDLAREVTMVVPHARATTRAGTPALDLPAAVRAQLRAGGVRAISAVGDCTRCEADRWFSHRAAGAGAAAEGRQLLVAARTSVPPPRAGASLQSAP